MLPELTATSSGTDAGVPSSTWVGVIRRVRLRGGVFAPAPTDEKLIVGTDDQTVFVVAIELPGMKVNSKNWGFAPSLTEMFHDVTTRVTSS